MKCTYVAFMYRVTRGTRTCFSQGCQFQPLAQPAKEGPVQLIKQKDRGGGGGGGKGEKGVGKCGKRGKRAGNSSIRPPPPPLITRTGKITRNQRRLETLRFYIVETIFERFEDISRENFLEKEGER